MKRFFILLFLFIPYLHKAQSDSLSIGNDSLSAYNDKMSNTFDTWGHGSFDMLFGLHVGDPNRTFLGIQYTRIPAQLGFQASLYANVDYGAVGLLLGPAYTIPVSKKNKSWQLFMGAGLSYSNELSAAFQLGTRYDIYSMYEDASSLSFNISALYLDKHIVPSLGISVMPAIMGFKELWREKEYRFPRHYSELVVGGTYYKEHFSYHDETRSATSLLVGFNYAYVPSKVGLNGSVYFSDRDAILFHVGPVYRLNDGFSKKVDIQVFQNIGYTVAYYEGYGAAKGISGETGIRFGFGRDKKYGLWSLSSSLIYNRNGVGATLGISWPIVGVTAVVAGAVALTILSAQSSLESLSSGKSRSSNDSGASSASSKNSSSADCSSLHNQYLEYESKVAEMLENREWMKSKDFSHISRATHNKQLRNLQSRMRSIRRKANSQGCNIQQSKLEYATAGESY